jgi:hypothetical protein
MSDVEEITSHVLGSKRNSKRILNEKLKQARKPVQKRSLFDFSASVEKSAVDVDDGSDDSDDDTDLLLMGGGRGGSKLKRGRPAKKRGVDEGDDEVLVVDSRWKEEEESKRRKIVVESSKSAAPIPDIIDLELDEEDNLMQVRKAVQAKMQQAK